MASGARWRTSPLERAAPQSALWHRAAPSKRTLSEDSSAGLASDRRKAGKKRRTKHPPLRRKPKALTPTSPDFIPPQSWREAANGHHPGAGWIHEIKFDGYLHPDAGFGRQGHPQDPEGARLDRTIIGSHRGGGLRAPGTSSSTVRYVPSMNTAHQTSPLCRQHFPKEDVRPRLLRLRSPVRRRYRLARQASVGSEGPAQGGSRGGGS